MADGNLSYKFEARDSNFFKLFVIAALIYETKKPKPFTFQRSNELLNGFNLLFRKENHTPFS
jgi:hypothetical protein